MQYLLGIIMIGIIYSIGNKIAEVSKSTFFDKYYIGVLTGVLSVFVYTLTITI